LQRDGGSGGKAALSRDVREAAEMNARLVQALAVVLILSLALGSVSAVGAVGPSGAAEPRPGAFAPGRILVKFRAGAAAAERADVHRALGGRVLEEIAAIGVEVVSVPARAELASVAAYARNPLVEYAEPDHVAYAVGEPNDPYFDKQWGLSNGNDADIDAPEAWGLTSGSGSVLIAILDTGIDQDHEDLAGKLVGNKSFTSSEKEDDLYGHGTHVAGIAAAATDNGIGVAGVGYDSRLLNVKVLDDTGSGYYSWIAKGIIWAADNGAKVINMSLGGSAPSRTLEEAVNYAWKKGVVLVAAAGNSGNRSPTYPAYYKNCIAVAATDSNDQKASWSSYGAWVDVAAPGVSIFSAVPNHTSTLFGRVEPPYAYGSGTSMATPHVAGVAALVWATSYGTSNASVRYQIEMTADKIAGTGTYWRYGRVNACRAVGGSCQ
jgi:thermitase